MSNQQWNTDEIKKAMFNSFSSEGNVNIPTNQGATSVDSADDKMEEGYVTFTRNTVNNQNVQNVNNVPRNQNNIANQPQQGVQPKVQQQQQVFNQQFQSMRPQQSQSQIVQQQQPSQTFKQDFTSALEGLINKKYPNRRSDDYVNITSGIVVNKQVFDKSMSTMIVSQTAKVEALNQMFSDISLQEAFELLYMAKKVKISRTAELNLASEKNRLFKRNISYTIDDLNDKDEITKRLEKKFFEKIRTDDAKMLAIKAEMKLKGLENATNLQVTYGWPDLIGMTRVQLVAKVIINELKTCPIVGGPARFIMYPGIWMCLSAEEAIVMHMKFSQSTLRLINETSIVPQVNYDYGGAEFVRPITRAELASTARVIPFAFLEYNKDFKMARYGKASPSVIKDVGVYMKSFLEFVIMKTNNNVTLTQPPSCEKFEDLRNAQLYQRVIKAYIKSFDGKIGKNPISKGKFDITQITFNN